MDFAKTCLILLTLVINIIPLQSVYACTKSEGKTEKDKEVASKMCSVFKSIPDILMMSVNESILYVDVSRDFYNAMQLDKISGTKLVKSWMNGMRQETGKKAITIWIYSDKIKVIEGQTSWTGEDEVEFLNQSLVLAFWVMGIYRSKQSY